MSIAAIARERTRTFCDRFGLRAPILLAPMAGSSPPGLAAAVANAGGMGGFGALMASPDAMREWAAQFRSRSNGSFQVNLWIPDPPPVRDAAHEARVREALSRLSGIEVPDPGAGRLVPDFVAQCEAMIEVAPSVASSIMGLFPPEVVARASFGRRSQATRGRAAARSCGGRQAVG
jgi:nitronate monooxygenase